MPLTEEEQAALRIAYADALLVQDLPTVGAVLHSLHDHMPALAAEIREFGKPPDSMNKHPVFILFVSRLNSLCGKPEMDEISVAWSICSEVEAGKVIVGSPEHKDAMGKVHERMTSAGEGRYVSRLRKVHAANKVAKKA